MKVIESWGFTYRTCMVWVKDKIGMGYYARQQHELLLIAMKGSPRVPAPKNRPSSVVNAPRSAHSKKPDLFYELIERMYPRARKVELFCRSPRDGWTAWGNEIRGAVVGLPFLSSAQSPQRQSSCSGVGRMPAVRGHK
jgi:N6-adenosine-specific RNA methylase IME4